MITIKKDHIRINGVKINLEDITSFNKKKEGKDLYLNISSLSSKEDLKIKFSNQEQLDNTITSLNSITTLDSGPAGSNSHVQYNNNDSFGGNSNFVYDENGGVTVSVKSVVNNLLEIEKDVGITKTGTSGVDYLSLKSGKDLFLFAGTSFFSGASTIKTIKFGENLSGNLDASLNFQFDDSKSIYSYDTLITGFNNEVHAVAFSAIFGGENIVGDSSSLVQTSNLFCIGFENVVSKFLSGFSHCSEIDNINPYILTCPGFSANAEFYTNYNATAIANSKTTYDFSALGVDTRCVGIGSVFHNAFCGGVCKGFDNGFAIGKDSETNNGKIKFPYSGGKRAIGSKSLSTRQFQIAHGGGGGGNVGSFQSSEYYLIKLTQNATPQEMETNIGNFDGFVSLFLSGYATTSIFTDTMILRDFSTWMFFIYVVARKGGPASGVYTHESAVYEIRGVIDRQSGAATTALVGAIDKTVREDVPAWDVLVDADTTNGGLRVRAVGEVGKPIFWYATVRTVEVCSA